MIVFKQARALSNFLSNKRKEGKKIGFAPTMGALHEGHLSLISASKKENDLTVCSIFINPTQFNNQEDFRLYPVTIETDIDMLHSAGCDVLFFPSKAEIYSEAYQVRTYEIGQIETILEGYYRPGHFQGVCQVVDRLLDIIKTDILYLGQKDLQQCLVITRMVELTGRQGAVEIKINPTVREVDGLAMSSRNKRLTEKERALATSIYNELTVVKARIGQDKLSDLQTEAVKNLEEKGFQVDYFEIVLASDLTAAETNQQGLVALVAASIGNTRLIDNMLLN